MHCVYTRFGEERSTFSGFNQWETDASNYSNCCSERM